MRIIWHNGVFKDQNQAILQIHDRGLRGHGVFDTMLVMDGIPVLSQSHFERLRNDAEIFGIKNIPSVRDLDITAKALIERNNIKTPLASLTTTISFGPGVRGISVVECDEPQIIMNLNEISKNQDPLKVIISKNIRRDELSLLSRIKSFNYGMNILAMQEARARGANEAVMINTNGFIACASTGNIFAVLGDRLVTPPLQDGILPGITRELLIKKHGAIQESLRVKDILEADHVFITNSLRGFVPVISLEDKIYPAVSAKFSDLLGLAIFT